MSHSHHHHHGRKLAHQHSDQPHHHKFDFRRFWEAPSLHQDWHNLQEERKVTWTELFFDLFYVVACINLSHQIEADISVDGFGRFFLYYSFFWGIWVSYTLFTSRVRLIGFVFDSISVVYMLGVLGMILHCNDSSHFARFAGCYAIVRLATTVQQATTAASIPRARPMSLVYMVLYASVAALALVITFVDRWKVFVGLGITCLALELVGPLSPMLFKVNPIPLHVDHVNERFGLIMMIFLGETIVSLGKSTLSFQASQYAAIAFAAVVIFNFHLLYYHTSPDQHSHALRLARNRGLLWNYAHWVLAATFLMLGAAIRISVASYVAPAPAAAPHRRAILAAATPEHHPPTGPPATYTPDATHAPTTATHTPTATPYAPTTADHAYPTAYPTASAAAHTFHAGDIEREVAWLLCISYAAAMHLIAIIRGTHYLLNPIIRAAGDNLGIRRWMDAWWMLGFLAPFAVYFMPLADLSAVALLGYLAAHGTAYNAAETLIAHRISGFDWTEAIHIAVDSLRGVAAVEGGLEEDADGVLGKGSLPTASNGDSAKANDHEHDV